MVSLYFREGDPSVPMTGNNELDERLKEMDWKLTGANETNYTTLTKMHREQVVYEENLERVIEWAEDSAANWDPELMDASDFARLDELKVLKEEVKNEQANVKAVIASLARRIKALKAADKLSASAEKEQ